MATVARLPDIDPEVVEICDALNRIRGIRTFESCSGHGGKPLKVFFTSRNPTVVAVLAEILHPRVSGLKGWQIRVFGRVGQGKNRKVSYVLETTQAAYYCGSTWQDAAHVIRNWRRGI